MHKGETMDGLFNLGQEPPAQPVSKTRPTAAVNRTNERAEITARLDNGRAALQSGEPDPRELALERLKSVLTEVADQLPPNAKLVIRRDEESNRFVYEFTDPVTGEVTRQFPTEEVLAAMRAAKQPAAGVMLDRKA